jgi:hypothetical protein
MGTMDVCSCSRPWSGHRRRRLLRSCNWTLAVTMLPLGVLEVIFLPGVLASKASWAVLAPA